MQLCKKPCGTYILKVPFQQVTGNFLVLCKVSVYIQLLNLSSPPPPKKYIFLCSSGAAVRMDDQNSVGLGKCLEPSPGKQSSFCSHPRESEAFGDPAILPLSAAVHQPFREQPQGQETILDISFYPNVYLPPVVPSVSYMAALKEPEVSRRLL